MYPLIDWPNVDVGGNQVSLICFGEIAVAVNAAGDNESSGFSETVDDDELVPFAFMA